MPKFEVVAPISGTVGIVVEAATEEDAWELAFEKFGLEHIEEWDIHRQLVVPMTKAEITEIDE